MKPISLLSFLLLLFVSSFTQTKTTIYFSHELQNETEKIKEYKINRELVYKYRADRKGRAKDSALLQCIYYDSTGQIIESRIFSSTYQLVKTNPISQIRLLAITAVNYYNKAEQLVRRINYQDTSKTKIRDIYEFEYDNSGNAITRYIYTQDTTHVIVEKRVYNEKKQVITEWDKIDTNAFYMAMRFFYDAKGRLERKDAFDAKGKPFYSYNYAYNDSLHTESIYLENRKKKNLAEENVYNEKHQMMQMSAFHKDNPNYKNFDYDTIDKFEYLSNGLIFSAHLFVDKKIDSFTKHFYFTD